MHDLKLKLHLVLANGGTDIRNIGLTYRRSDFAKPPVRETPKHPLLKRVLLPENLK